MRKNMNMITKLKKEAAEYDMGQDSLFKNTFLNRLDRSKGVI